jgi:general secretion pathway protein E
MNETLTKGRCIDLGGLLKDLVRDGILSRTDAADIAGNRRSRDEALLHPLEIIVAKQLQHTLDSRPLTIELLSQWLAEKATLQLAHIDPLKINVPAVTAVMSFAYAKRYGILCVDVSREELVIATMEPFDNSWIESLEQTSRRAIRRVVASPTDIKKYTLEFYSLAKSAPQWQLAAAFPILNSFLKSAT